jgi:hypothetical protein
MASFGFVPLLSEQDDFQDMMEKVATLQTRPLQELWNEQPLLENLSVSLSPSTTVKEALTLLDPKNKDDLYMIDFIVNSPKTKFSPVKHYELLLVDPPKRKGGAPRRSSMRRKRRQKKQKRVTKRR